MHGGRIVLGVFGAVAFAPFLAFAQQKPVSGCGAAPSCQQNGFSVLTGNSHVLFSFGVAWDPGFHAGIIPAHGGTEAVGTQQFHLKTSALAPSAQAAPAFTAPNLLAPPAPTPASEAEPPKD